MANDSESIKNLIAVCNQLGRDVAVISHNEITDYYLLVSFEVLENFIEVIGISANNAVEKGIFNAQFMQNGSHFSNTLDSKIQEMFNSSNVKVKYDKTAKYKVYCK